MRLRDEARRSDVAHARLLLAARGVEPTAHALAGALLEAERDQLIIGLIRGMARRG